MTRLQKKCLIAAAGAHLLVIVAVLCSGFIRSTPKVDDSTLLTVIPSNLIDAMINQGAKNAPTPPSTPPTPVTPPTPTPPTPEPPKPVVTPPVEPVKPPEPVTPPEDLKPMERPDAPIPKPKKTHVIQVNTAVVTRDSKLATQDAAAAAAKADREAKRQQEKRLKAIRDAARAIKENASSATTVEMPGTGSVSYANYASVVKSIYEAAWTPPDSAASDDANVKVSVTIGSDGTVISSHVVDPSGDSSVDDSVRRTLDRVTFIAPFPDGASEKEKTFIINFNLKSKRMLG